ncbi:5-formyltetrahydrofolate cyclo-ligase [Arthrobacter castelli]|uniref:5-formyltetrahydrofolate cyclo-ligase n=1 Tax=Arthrobacter castelli TaxID=271431 RepID=UPI00041605ED|nr:5-formyltetrahydrofolate cyclo-ligase [Arthrobacter castelli]
MTVPGRSKTSVRSRHRAQRRSASVTQRRTAAASLADTVLEWLQQQHDGGPVAVAAYLGIGAEPATDVLLDRLHESGHRIFLPACEPQFQLGWVRWRPDTPLVASALAPVMEPVGVHETVQVMEDVDLVLLPALAADTAGNRLGQGGGYYDRFLASLSQVQQRPRTAAVVYADELLDAGSFAHTPLDLPVDGVFTPRSWHSTVQ